MRKLDEGYPTDVFNLGTGNGYSNKQIIDMIEKVSGRQVKINYTDRRPGDADKLIADNSKIKDKFNWQPQYSDLQNIIQTAWDWHSKQNI